jgi:hypothetical protein
MSSLPARIEIARQMTQGDESVSQRRRSTWWEEAVADEKGSNNQDRLQGDTGVELWPDSERMATGNTPADAWKQ